MVRNILMLLLATFCLIANAAAGDWKHAVQACDEAAKAAGQPGAKLSIFELNQLKPWLIQKLDRRYPWEDCVLKLAGIDWLAPTFGSIAPGSSFAAGLRSQHAINHGRKQSMLTARGLYSLKNFYFMEGRFDLHMPAPGQSNPVTATMEDQTTISLFARRIDLHTQDFYGTGENTKQIGLAQYRQQQDEIGGEAYFPLLPWFAAGGGLKYLAPKIDGISNSKTSIELSYSPSQAPGLAQQPAFVDYQALLRVRTPSDTKQTWNQHDVRLTYDYFHNAGSGNNSFHKLQVFAMGSFDIRKNIPSVIDRRWWQDAICQSIVGDQCRLANLVLDGLVTTSFYSGANVVPFYLQDTLGGSDIHGFDTLRGLADYRLRAPNRVLLQADLYKDLWGPFGIYGFYDTGKVALHSSDLSLTHLRHDFGPGIFVRAGGNIVLRAYIGFGAGEGSHPNFKLFNAF